MYSFPFDAVDVGDITRMRDPFKGDFRHLRAVLLDVLHGLSAWPPRRKRLGGAAYSAVVLEVCVKGDLP